MPSPRVATGFLSPRHFLHAYRHALLAGYATRSACMWLFFREKSNANSAATVRRQYNYVCLLALPAHRGVQTSILRRNTQSRSAPLSNAKQLVRSAMAVWWLISLGSLPRSRVRAATHMQYVAHGQLAVIFQFAAAMDGRSKGGHGEDLP